MPYAITLLLDRQAAIKVSAMYEALSARNISHDQVKLAYPPHLTLVVLDDSAGARELANIVSEVTQDWRTWLVRFAGFGLFPGTPWTLWLCPVTTSELLERQASLCRALPSTFLRDYYVPGLWVPHVTLAKDVSEPTTALAAVQSLELPPDTKFVEIQLIHFRPPTVIWQKALSNT
jgi:2'-5' RNA ligase